MNKSKEDNINQEKFSYKKAGVDIEAGNNFVKKISSVVAETKIKGTDAKIGGFGGIFDLAKLNFKDPVLVATNDGVGTKLKIAIETNSHKGIGIDLVAMCVNDLIVQGAKPLFFLDYYSTGYLDNEVAYEVVASIAEGCKIAGCALIGGETAEMPGMYAKGDYDLAGFSVGAAERNSMLPTKDISAGDLLLGIASSGFHSNGFSLIRKILHEKSVSLDYKPSFSNGKNLYEILLQPTKIYVKSVLDLIDKGYVKALAHITGGGLTENIPRVLTENVYAEIDCSKWIKPEIFKWFKDLGNIDNYEMLRIFNSGVGMVAVIKEENLLSVTKILESYGEKVFPVGIIKERKLNNSPVEYINLSDY